MANGKKLPHFQHETHGNAKISLGHCSYYNSAPDFTSDCMRRARLLVKIDKIWDYRVETTCWVSHSSAFLHALCARRRGTLPPVARSWCDMRDRTTANIIARSIRTAQRPGPVSIAQAHRLLKRHP